MEVIRKRLTKKTVGPLFIYAHFVDPHAPYKAGRKGDPPFLRYLGEVKKVDRQLVGLMGHLDAMELTTRTMLIVSADHGEAFGEHNTHYHSKTVYEEALRVPLMVRARRLKPATVSEPVTLLDLGPTILDLFGVAAPGNTLGQSLVPLLRGETIALTRPIVVDSGRRQQALFFSDNHKAIMDLHKGTTAVFDLAADPGERKNLASSAGKLHLRTMKQFFALHRLRRPGYTPPRRRF
jgi:arylsulfatase A-like enzyme